MYYVLCNLEIQAIHHRSPLNFFGPSKMLKLVVAVTPTERTSNSWTRSTFLRGNPNGCPLHGFARSKLTASTELLLPSTPLTPFQLFFFSSQQKRHEQTHRVSGAPLLPICLSVSSCSSQFNQFHLLQRPTTSLPMNIFKCCAPDDDS